MPVIRRFAASVLSINIRDHPPPHFHVMLSDGREALVRIDNVEIIRGNVRSREIAEMLAWARSNREFLSAKFEELQQ